MSKQLVNRFNVEMTPELNQQIRNWYPEGILEDELPDVLKRIEAPAFELKVVGNDK